MIMIKLKQNLSFGCLSILTFISLTTCHRYFRDYVPILSGVMKCAIVWPDKENILNNNPKCFSNFKNVRVILDCTEIMIKKPKCLHCRILTYSHYYGGHKAKFLIGVSPAGLITYIVMHLVVVHQIKKLQNILKYYIN